MWAKNLLFVGLVLAGFAALAGGLFPERISKLAEKESAPVITPTSDREPIVDELDRLFRDQWAEKKLQPAPRAADLTVARRLGLALTGSIPSLEEIRHLEARPQGQRVHAYLAQLLQDRRYADYFAERLARVYVGTEDGPFFIYRRRRFVSWLSDDLLKNRPYDQIVRDLIADEGLSTDKPATNFVTVTFEPGKGPNPERLAARVARAFLGIRLDCAQCHDHPFQPWKQKDFQGLAAYFGQVHEGFTGTYDSDGEFQVDKRKTGTMETIEPNVPFLPELAPDAGTRRRQLADWVTNPSNQYFAQATVNRVWALMFGKPLVEPIDDLPSAGEPPTVLRLLAHDFNEHGYDLRRLIQIIAATEVFQLDSAIEPEVTDGHRQTWAIFPLTRLRPEQVVGGILQAASLETNDRSSHIVARFFRFINEREFVERYGDMGEDEFASRGGTIPQRLLMMNGQIVFDRTENGLLTAAKRISFLAPDDRSAVETSYLATLTRRPTKEEASHFEERLAESGNARSERIADLFWTLINSTEFSWNH
jgi:Protein of unknown function (DUF1549)/Protein of unknown function (DUF1553)